MQKVGLGTHAPAADFETASGGMRRRAGAQARGADSDLLEVGRGRLVDPILLHGFDALAFEFGAELGAPNRVERISEEEAERKLGSEASHLQQGAHRK